MCAYDYVVYLYCLNSIGEQGVVGQRPNSVLVLSRIFCYGFFEDVMFWFLQRYSDSGMGKTSTVHKGDFLGLKVFIQRLMFYFVQSGSVCNSPILLGNTIYMFFIMCTLHLETLLTKCRTHIYTYIVDNTIDI